MEHVGQKLHDMGRPAAGIFGMGSAGVDNESALYFGGPSGTSPVISGADEYRAMEWKFMD